MMSLLLQLCLIGLLVVPAFSQRSSSEIERTNVMLSISNIPPEGYISAGSLFEGTGYWSTSLVTNYALSDFSAIEHDGIVYFPGGQNDENKMLASVASFDPQLLKFNQSAVPPMPTPRSRYGVAKINSTVFIAGGQVRMEKGGEDMPEACMISIDLDEPLMGWETEYACMSVNRSDFCLVAVEDSLYAIGGYNEFYEQLASIERFDPIFNVWELIASIDIGRGDVSCVAVNELIYILGGVYGGADWSVPIEEWFLDSLVSFDTVTGEIVELASMPNVRGDFALVALPGERLLVMGGETHYQGGRTQVAQHFVEEYDIGQDVWIGKAPMDQPRFRFGAVYVDGAVYTYGGHQNCDTDACAPTTLSDIGTFVDVQHPTVFIHQKAEGVSTDDVSQEVILSYAVEVEGYKQMGSVRKGSGYWTRIPDMPMKLSDFKVVEFDGKLLIAGGLNEKNEVQDSIVLYDPVLMTYNTLSRKMPEPRMRFAAAITDDKLYVIGGYNTSDYDLQDEYGPASQSMVLDLLDGTWNFGPSLSTPRSDLCAAVVNNTIYVVGGWPAGFTESLDSIESLSPEDQEFIQVSSSLPTPRGDCQAISIGNEVVVIGGYYDPTGSWDPDSFRDEVEAYDVETGEWKTLAPLPNARGDKAVVKLGNDRILVIGGETHARGEATEVGTRYVEEYFGDQNVWVEKAPLPEGKFRAGAGFVDGGVYVFGGHGVCPGLNVDCPETAMSTSYVYYDVDVDNFLIHVKN